MTKEEKRARATAVCAKLEEIYPDAECALEYDGDPWRLLVMGRLSAQCTDARVNIVCRDLFAAYPTAVDMAAAPVEEIEKLIYSCGFYRMKAQNLKDFSAIITEKFGGRVPDTMEDLLTLPGVGRKIANLILGDVYHKPAVVADTHCIRISNRLGLCGSKEPQKVEFALRELLPPEKSSDFCHRIVWFGRDTCDARKPKCETCPFASYGCIK
ncbi:MAG: endonuclease III [Ruminococcus sp.]|nr:endonuclease III [Candidatus Apopatosoma intestinale]